MPENDIEIKPSQEKLLESLSESNRLITAIMASTRHLIISTDSEGTVTFFNSASEEALGYKSADVVGKHTPALWHDVGEVVQRADELSRELEQNIRPGFDVFIVIPKKKGQESREWTFWRKDGTKFPANLTVTCIRDDNNIITGYLGVIEDITERKKTGEEIKEAKAFLDLMLNNNPDLVFVKDSKYRLVEVNTAFRSLYPPEKQDKIIGYTTFEEYSEEDVEIFLKKDKEAFEKGKSQVIESVVFPNGVTRIYDTTKIRFENNVGEEYILCLGRDVTDKEKLIDGLSHSNEKLEHFAYICSHDLQEPLRMVRSFSDMLQDHLGASLEDDKKGKLYLKYIMDGAERAQMLIADILTYSSIDKDTLKPEKVNIEELLVDIKSNMQLDIDTTKGKIMHDKLPILIGNKTQFYQLFQNLISNAMKYKKEDVKPLIHVGIENEENYWKFFVRDNGIGIEKPFLKKIFDVFQRLHHKEEYVGTGIGLSICRKIVEKHGGQIWAESEFGKGSTFYFTILKSNN